MTAPGNFATTLRRLGSSLLRAMAYNTPDLAFMPYGAGGLPTGQHGAIGRNRPLVRIGEAQVSQPKYNLPDENEWGWI